MANSFTKDIPKDAALRDYRVAVRSREASLLGRREVLTGKAKFGIFGDGKELPQLAMARVFQNGDIRSGYYRDQTFMLAAGMLSLDQLFSQLYADPELDHEPASGGRQMNCHFATRTLDDDGNFKRLVDVKTSAADSSPTASQMPRLVGLAYASRLYRQLPELAEFDGFSDHGNEIAFGTIGNASCAEGPFWEAINAVGVLRAPMLMSIWDDDYGISVSNEHQITKRDLSAVLSGFSRSENVAGGAGKEGKDAGGYLLRTVAGWDYPALCRTYAEVAEQVRRDHVPAIIHVIELTQPQGHSTSGSHERYKSKERLDWERDWDGLDRMRQWLIDQNFATAEDLDTVREEVKQEVREAQQTAWQRFLEPIKQELDEVASLIEGAAEAAGDGSGDELTSIAKNLRRVPSPLRRHLAVAARDALLSLGPLALRPDDQQDLSATALRSWWRRQDVANRQLYSSHLYRDGDRSALAVPSIEALYDSNDSGASVPSVNGFEVLNKTFDAALARHPELIAFGEDVGQLGDVNQGFSGLQAKYGELRVSDTGIRECTILGQAIGMAMRGLRPLCEIQYLDYVHYALQIIADDLATLHYRTRGGQKAPVIIRTRGHRLEGIWHSGSPMAGILGLVRGVYVCVPRDMTRAAGMYNTLLQSDDSAIVVEVLNGYRVKEDLPSNVEEMTVPLGVPEVIRQGSDLTVVTYGACCRIAEAAADKLERFGIDVEIIDVQTLLPFDRTDVIGASLRKTNRALFLDEDVPGGASAYMQQQVLEHQNAFHWLDSPPHTLSAAAHRPPYGSDGDYWSKPSVEDVFDAVYDQMHEAEPSRFPLFYR